MATDLEKIQIDLNNAQKKLDQSRAEQRAFKDQIELAKKLIKAAEDYEKLRKQRMNEAQKALEKASKHYQDVSDSLNDYFDIEEEATPEEKEKLKTAEAERKTKLAAFSQAKDLYEGAHTEGKNTKGALEILSESKLILAQIKQESIPKSEKAKDQREHEKAQAEEEALLRAQMTKRRADLQEKPATPSSAKESTDTPQKLNIENLEGGAVAQLFGQRSKKPLERPASVEAFQSSSAAENPAPSEVPVQKAANIPPPPPPPLPSESKAKEPPPHPVQEKPSSTTPIVAPEKREKPPSPPSASSKPSYRAPSESQIEQTTVQEFKIQDLLQSLHSTKGQDLFKRREIVTEKHKHLGGKRKAQMQMAQSIIDALNEDQTHSLDEKAEILTGLILNLRQQLQGDPKSKFRKVVEEVYGKLDTAGYTMVTHQMPFLAFMQSLNLRKNDKTTFERFVECSHRVLPPHAVILRRTAKQKPLPESKPLDQIDESTLLFNQFLLRYAPDPQNRAQKALTLRERYRLLGGKEDKEGSKKSCQIDFLEECIRKLYEDNSLAGGEKATMMAGILENLMVQLQNHKNSKLTGLVKHAYGMLPPEAKNSFTKPLSAEFVNKHHIGANNKTGLDLFNKTLPEIEKKAKMFKGKK